VNKLFILPEARKDLEWIKAYISEELENPIAALDVVSRITQSLKNLREMSASERFYPQKFLLKLITGFWFAVTIWPFTAMRTK
jgi:plasmid stabilization system protein ParE